MLGDRLFSVCVNMYEISLLSSIIIKKKIKYLIIIGEANCIMETSTHYIAIGENTKRIYIATPHHICLMQNG
jgi:hypothetical protein